MNFTFIGMPGAGKSTIGRKVAEILGYNFIDVDSVLEQNERLKISQLLAKYGENFFLELEEKAILSLDLIDNYVISPGGSVIYVEQAMLFLKNKSKIIFLDVPLKSIEKRLKDTPRGIVGLSGKSLEKLYFERQFLYQKYADVVLKVSEDSGPEEVVRELLLILQMT